MYQEDSKVMIYVHMIKFILSELNYLKVFLSQFDINSNPKSITVYNYLINLSTAYFGQTEFTKEMKKESYLFYLGRKKQKEMISEPLKI